MHTLHQTLLAVHVICGAILLFLFWVPMLAKKGSPLHIKSGQYFGWLMYFVTIPGFLMSMLVLWDPVATRGVDVAAIANLDKFLAMNRAFAFFLAVLSLLGFVQLRHAIFSVTRWSCSQPSASPTTLCADSDVIAWWYFTIAIRLDV
ncbi:MAG: hypothetical protein U5L01_04890 [Rheinheimera sp.]|nr:hypothetical protein [Rheinheimera sp.]